MSTRADKAGAIYGIAAYVAWGLFPIYFKAVKEVDAGEILCHRIVWSAVFLVGLMGLRGRLGEARAALRDRRVRGAGGVVRGRAG